MSNLLRLDGRVEIQAAADNTKTPRVEILGYSGDVMNVPGWGPVVINLSGLDITPPTAILADHRNELSGIVGTGVAEVRDNKLYVSGPIVAATEAGKQIIDLGKAGFPFQASVGVEPAEREYVRSGDTRKVNGRTIKAGDGGYTLIARGKLREISITALGSDPSTRVSVAASMKGQKMSSDTTTNTTTPDPLLAAWDQPGLSDPERVQARWAAAKWHYETAGPKERAHRAMIAATAGRLTYQDFEKVLLEERCCDSELAVIRLERPQGPMITASSRDPVNSEAVFQGAILAHLGHEKLGEKVVGVDAMQRARDMRAHGFVDICKAALLAESKPVPSNTDGLIRAAFSTTTLPVALGSSAEKIAMAAYSDAPQTWRSWAAIKPASNFKTHTGIRLSDTLTLDEVGSGGELHHAQLGESTYSYKVATYAKMVTLTRQEVINDDLGMFNEVPTMFGRSAARRLNDLVYTVLLGNAGSFFAGGNNNYLSSGTSALSVTSLASAVAALRNQQDADGSPLDLVPRVLLVGPTLEPTARQLLNSVELLRVTTDQLPTGNPMQSLNLALEVEPRIESAAFTGYSTTKWYLLCGPQDAVAIVSFLNGQESPTVESIDPGPSVLGIGWRVYLDFGAALADPKAGVMSAGA